MKTKIESMFESAYNFINCEEECYYIKSEILDYLCGKEEFPGKYSFKKFDMQGFYKKGDKFPANKLNVIISFRGTDNVYVEELVGESELEFYIK